MLPQQAEKTSNGCKQHKSMQNPLLLPLLRCGGGGGQQACPADALLLRLVRYAVDSIWLTASFIYREKHGNNVCRGPLFVKHASVPKRAELQIRLGPATTGDQVVLTFCRLARCVAAGKLSYVH